MTPAFSDQNLCHEHLALALGHLEVLMQAVHHPDGTEPLWEAQVECAAALYQVHPERIEAVRAALTSEPVRAAALDAVRVLGGTCRSVGRRTVAPNAHRLLVLAAHSAECREWLVKAPLERAATRFGAHVFEVEEARRALTAS